MKFIYLFATLFVCLLKSFNIHAQVYVKQDATGLNNGTSWQNAYTNLDTAISKTASGTIWVAKGDYKPGVKAQNTTLPYNVFSISKKIGLYGGFKGDETALAQRDISKNITILNGDLGIAGDSSDNTPIIIRMIGIEIDSTTVLDGFTIKGANYPGAAPTDYNVAAVLISGPGVNSSPVIRNCTIRENNGYYGAAIWVNNSTPLITNNVITNNSAVNGAGIYCADYLSNPQVINNKIINNRCLYGAGGGIFISAYSSPYIYGNLIENNTAGNGGGIAYQGNYDAWIVNNVISHNTAGSGAGVYISGSSVKLINNLVAGNMASYNGGALYLDYTVVECTNNTIVNNTAKQSGSAVYAFSGKLLATSNIIYHNPSAQDYPISMFPGNAFFTPRFNYNDIENGLNGIGHIDTTLRDSIWQAGNIDQYPVFVDSLNYNFQLVSQSPCINNGKADTAAFSLPAIDLALNKRLAGNRIDMGCYEFDNAVNTASPITIQPGRLQLNGTADSTFTLTINSNLGWSLINNASWLQPLAISGVGNIALPVKALANPNLQTDRTARMLVSSNQLNTPSIPVTIYQSKGGYIRISPDTAYISDDNFRSTYLNLKSNSYWGIIPPGWMSISPSSGNAGSTSIYVRADSNFTGNTRYITLVFGNQYFNPDFSDSVVIVQLPTRSKVCAGSTIHLSAGINGASFQWQKNIGSGFTNITNDATYAGATTGALTINNVPSSLNAVQFRCKVDSAEANVYTLQIYNYWIGGTTAWENAANWSCGKVPDANTDVANFNGNIVISSNVTVRSLSVSNGASVTVMPGYTLTILH